MGKRADDLATTGRVLRIATVAAIVGCLALLAAVTVDLRRTGRELAALSAMQDAAGAVSVLALTPRDELGSDRWSTEVDRVRDGLAAVSTGVEIDRRRRELLIRVDAILTQAQRAGGGAGDFATADRGPAAGAARLVEASVLMLEIDGLARARLEALTGNASRRLAAALILACASALLVHFERRYSHRVGAGREAGMAAGSLPQLLATAVRSTDEGILISDTGSGEGEPMIVFANESFKAMAGHEADDLIGKPLSYLRETSLREQEFSLLEHSYSDSRSASIETVRLLAGGSRVHCDWHISPVRADGGRVTHYISILRDITSLREHEEAQRRSHKELLEANRRLVENQRQLIQSEKMAFLGQLAAGVAHEINNPVGYVMSNLETLAEDIAAIRPAVDRSAAGDALDAAAALEVAAFADETTEIVSDSIAGLDRVKQIVQSLKNFARPDDASIEEADINHEIDEALKIIWNEVKHRCTVTKRFGLLPPYRCRPGQLNQVFTNLLINAVQAIPERGEITVVTEHTGAEIVVRITDNGEGIAEHHRASLFTPFFTTKPAGKGTGLGLSVSYGIVQNHNGTIEVESAPGRGSTFTVRLPISGANDVS